MNLVTLKISLIDDNKCGGFCSHRVTPTSSIYRRDLPLQSIRFGGEKPAIFGNQKRESDGKTGGQVIGYPNH